MFGSIGMDCVKIESCYKGTILYSKGNRPKNKICLSPISSNWFILNISDYFETSFRQLMEKLR